MPVAFGVQSAAAGPASVAGVPPVSVATTASVPVAASVGVLPPLLPQPMTRKVARRPVPRIFVPLVIIIS